MTDNALPIAVDFIAGFEQFRAAVYQDEAGVWTNGYGFTYQPGGGRVTANTPPITEADARARLGVLVNDVLLNVRAMVHVPMTDEQAAALTSFAYNCGTGALRGSTLLRLFESGETVNAAARFGEWVKAGGHTSAGLVRRRAAEAKLFLSNTPALQPCVRPNVPTASVNTTVMTADDLDALYNPTITETKA